MGIVQWFINKTATVGLKLIHRSSGKVPGLHAQKYE
jgi:hypothetical protein